MPLRVFTRSGDLLIDVYAEKTSFQAPLELFRSLRWTVPVTDDPPAPPSAADLEDARSLASTPFEHGPAAEQPRHYWAFRGLLTIDRPR